MREPPSPATDMLRLASSLFVAFVLFAAALVALTTAALPDPVATHFALGGRPNGWMSRDGYRAFMLVLMLTLPLAIHAGTAWLPRRFPNAQKPAMRDYWLAPPRREATLAALTRYGLGLATMTEVLLVGMHASIVHAHTVSPPRLDEPVFFVGMLVFAAILGIIVIRMAVRFRIPRERRPA
jgi:hypothetical protein